MKKDIFKDELHLIQNESLRKIALKLLDYVPDYFYRLPASSTGKYHPEFARGEGGLVRHTKAGMILANELLGLKQSQFTMYQADLIMIAILFHDAWKYGVSEEKHTRKDHAEIATKQLSTLLKNEKYFREEDTVFILQGVLAHMGQWGNREPKLPHEKFIHMIDYIISRKFIEFNF